MADVTTNTNGTGETEPTDANTQRQSEGKKTPTVEELMAELANARAEREKYKNASDKATSEAAKYKKELRSKQTAEEQEAEAKAEADRQKDEQLENVTKELNHIKAVAAYKSVSEKSVERLVEAVTDADHAAIAAIIDGEVKAAVAAAKAEWIKSRPRVNTGAYSGMTKDQIMAITDRAERRKAIAMNQELFE